jgi:2-methylcitrate dehydratase PrpD
MADTLDQIAEQIARQVGKLPVLSDRKSAILNALREARADALREAAEEAFTAGWVAAERLEDNEWGPSPAKDPESAFADWLRARALIAKVSQ